MSYDLPLPHPLQQHDTLHADLEKTLQIKVQSVINKYLQTHAQYTTEQRGKQSGLNTGSARDRKNKKIWAENDRKAEAGQYIMEEQVYNWSDRLKVSHLRSRGQKNDKPREGSSRKTDRVVDCESALVVNEVRGPDLPNRELSQWMTHTVADKNQEAMGTLWGLKGPLGDVPERWQAKILQFCLQVQIALKTICSINWRLDMRKTLKIWHKVFRNHEIGLWWLSGCKI